MGTRSNPDPDRDAQLPPDQSASTSREELRVLGLVREPTRPDHFLHHALPPRPDTYFIFHPAHGG